MVDVHGCVITSRRYTLLYYVIYKVCQRCDIHTGVGFCVVHSKTTILICYLLDYQQVRENTNVSIILLGDKKEPTK